MGWTLGRQKLHGAHVEALCFAARRCVPMVLCSSLLRPQGGVQIVHDLIVGVDESVKCQAPAMSALFLHDQLQQSLSSGRTNEVVRAANESLRYMREMVRRNSVVSYFSAMLADRCTTLHGVLLEFACACGGSGPVNAALWLMTVEHSDRHGLGLYPRPRHLLLC